MANATTTLKAGDEVSSWCTKCKEMHNHRVKAIGKDDKPARVVCTCPEQRERNYRPNPPKSARKSSSKRTVKKPTEEPHQWEKLIAGTDPSKARAYEMSGQFVSGDRVDHRKFGPGVVTELLDAHKMVVVFEDKIRIMVFNKAL